MESADQTVNIPEGTKGIVFGSDYHCDDESVPDEERIWEPNTYARLDINATAPVAFARGVFSDITIHYATDTTVMVNDSSVHGSLYADTAASQPKNLFVGRGVSVYGISGFDRLDILQESGQDDEGNTWTNRQMAFDAPSAATGIMLGNIGCAVLDENGVPRKAEANDEKSEVRFNLNYHEEYIPKLAAGTDLGTYENTEDQKSYPNPLSIAYYKNVDTWESYSLPVHTQVVAYLNAVAWKASPINYCGAEGDPYYEVDAEGKLFYGDNRVYSLLRYPDVDTYRKVGHEDVNYDELEMESIADADNLPAVMQAAVYDSTLNKDAYYELNVQYAYEEGETEAETITGGSLQVPSGVKGIRISTNGTGSDENWQQTTLVLNDITVPSGAQVELTNGAYQAADGSLNIRGGGEVSLWNTREFKSDVILEDDSVCAVGDSSLTGKISASPANGTIGTVKFTGCNTIAGIDGIRTVAYDWADINVVGSRGLNFYDITNGYDGTDADSAKGNLNLNIEGAPAEKNIPVFHNPVSLGSFLETAWEIKDTGVQYPVYVYEDNEAGNYQRYAKYSDGKYYPVWDGSGCFDAGVEAASGTILEALEKTEQHRNNSGIFLRYGKNFGTENEQDIEVTEGTKIYDVTQADAATAGSIWDAVQYNNIQDFEKDIDGRTIAMTNGKNIQIRVYAESDPEQSADEFVQDEVQKEMETAFVANTASAKNLNLWLAYLSQTKGYAYIKAESSEDGKVNFGKLVLPEALKGLFIKTNTDWDSEDTKIAEAGIESITASAAGQKVKIKGAINRDFAFIPGSYDAELMLAGARVNGVLDAGNAKVTIDNTTVVSTLTNVKTLNLKGELTVVKDLSFAEDGILTVAETDKTASLLAKSGATIELPDVNAIYDEENGYAKEFEILEEVDNGVRPTITFTGTLNMGNYWDKLYLSVYRGEDGDWEFKELKLPIYYYASNGEQCNCLVVLEGKVYQFTWGNEENAVSSIEINGETWDLGGIKLIDLSDKYQEADLQTSSWENMLKLMPFDAAKAKENPNYNVDIFTSDRYYPWMHSDEWNCEYDGTQAVSDYQMTQDAATIENFRQIALYYGTYVDDEYCGSYVEVYPVAQYLADREEGDTTFTDADAYTDDGLLRKYALYSNIWQNDIGEAEITKSSHYITVSAAPADLADTSKFTVKTGSYTYNGTAYKDKPVVTFTGDASTPSYVLQEGKDYTLSYADNTNAGTATVTITAIAGRGLKGSRKAGFTIAAKSITSGTVSSIASQTYTGKALTPVVTVKDGNSVLVKGKDYTISYLNNTNAGTATVTIKGTGNYTGTITKTFKIEPKSISKLTVKGIGTKYYNGKKQTQSLSVYDGAVKLNASCYTVTYKNHTNIGKATIELKGKGNYTGSLKKTFTISVKKNATYKAGNYQYKITNAAVNGKGTVTVLKPVKSTIKTVKIADTVTIGGVKFKITAINKAAFKNCKKLTGVTIGKNVKEIGDSAFYGCVALKTVTIGSGVTKLGKETFAKDKKLKQITIASTGLKTVGKKALQGIDKKAVIKVPSKKVKAYQKLFKGKGQASTVKIKKK